MLSGMYNLTTSDGTVAQAQLGDEVNIGGATYKYCKASGALAQYALCHISAAMLAVQSTTALVGTVARPTGYIIPQFAVADTEYFWGAVGPFYLREDNVTAFKVLAQTLCATAVKLYTTTTAGELDDSVTTAIVGGLQLSATNSAGVTVATACVAHTRLVAFCEL